MQNKINLHSLHIIFTTIAKTHINRDVKIFTPLINQFQLHNNAIGNKLVRTLTYFPYIIIIVKTYPNENCLGKKRLYKSSS